ncbi:hypothetical protein [Pelagicoccus sp. SDUM812003]|uniref:anti-sigma factor family protein n=1 Tax=Pelagicoccus sp. SDUM812003 TaxID=3041267 RepID=UPI00280FDA63|nr:hypothetical protein [Pelagicoccus sp. SDUM812003]MDQ8205082.1 hypothetical protein [Pelagicoccus sp. SDUM812003]
MNKERFIEKLNLYLDDELSSEESEKLIAAVRRNPEYHRIYLQYRQIHQACAQLGDAYSNPEKAAPAWRQKVYALGGMAAAVGLLALAAQNLSPFVSRPALAEPLIAETPPAKTSVNVAQAEPLQVMKVEEIDGKSYRLEDSFEVVSFDLESIFQEAKTATSFAPPLGVEFARFEVGSKSKPEHKWQQNFAFGEPVQASTFEHEAVSSQERAANDYGLQAVDAREDGIVADSSVRFDLERAAATLRERSRP